MFRYEKVYTNFEEVNPHLREPNRCFVLEMAKILDRFKKELKENIRILDDIDLMKKVCPTYLSLIDLNDLELLKSIENDKIKIFVEEGQDHHFSKSEEEFQKIPDKYLFETNPE